MPTTSYSVELFVFILFLDDLKCIIPAPNMMHPPVFPFMPSCTVYEFSTHMVIKVKPSMDNANLSSRVPCTNCRSLFNFFQSNLSGELNLVHKNKMEVYKSGWDLFLTIIFFVKYCRIFCAFPYLILQVRCLRQTSNVVRG